MSAPVVDIAHLKTWQGRTQSASDVVSPRLVAGFRATLDQVDAELTTGAPAPVGLHWCLAPPASPTAELGEDGHAARGGFLPPVPLPRRMWAGGRISFEGELRVGDAVERRSTIKSVELKTGRSGSLVFVVVEHVFTTGRGPAIVEQHDIVYRGLEAPAVRVEADRQREDRGSAVRRRIDASPVRLFRYSALTFNSHRIHYDYPYVTQVEGYPGLIVHGPLQATLLMGLATEMLSAALASFSFRATKPLFDTAPFVLTGRETADGLVLAVEDEHGDTTMSALARTA